MLMENASPVENAIAQEQANRALLRWWLYFVCAMILAMVVVGGQGSIVGAIIAALAISSLSEFLKPLEESLELYGLVQIIIAMLLIMVLLWRPRGLFGLREPFIKTVPPQ